MQPVEYADQLDGYKCNPVGDGGDTSHCGNTWLHRLSVSKERIKNMGVRLAARPICSERKRLISSFLGRWLRLAYCASTSVTFEPAQHTASILFGKPLGCWGCRRMGAKSGGEKLRKLEWPARILRSTGNSPLHFLSTQTFASSSTDRVSGAQSPVGDVITTSASQRTARAGSQRHANWGSDCGS